MRSKPWWAPNGSFAMSKSVGSTRTYQGVRDLAGINAADEVTSSAGITIHFRRNSIYAPSRTVPMASPATDSVDTSAVPEAAPTGMQLAGGADSNNRFVDAGRVYEPEPAKLPPK